MKKRLLIIRNPESKLLDYINIDRENQTLFLVQNGVYSSKLVQKGAKVMENDAKARGLDIKENLVNFDGMLDSILESDQVITI